MIKFYKIICDIIRCFVTSCAIALLIFFFDEQSIYTKENARTIVGGIYAVLFILVAMYVLIFERTRYKATGTTVTTEPIGRAALTNTDVADYNRKISSTHEAGHAVMSYLKNFEQYDAFVTDTNPHVVCVYKAQDAAGVRNYIVMLYAGAAAEELFFGSFHSGVAYGDNSDFKKAVDYMKMYLMMTHSDISKACLDEETSVYIKELSDVLYNESLDLLSQNRHMVETIANKLEANGSLTTKGIKELLKTMDKGELDV